MTPGVQWAVVAVLGGAAAFAAVVWFRRTGGTAQLTPNFAATNPGVVPAAFDSSRQNPPNAQGQRAPSDPFSDVLNTVSSVGKGIGDAVNVATGLFNQVSGFFGGF